MGEDIFNPENQLALYIENAYIDSLTINIDVIDKLKEAYQEVKKFFTEMWEAWWCESK